MELLGDQDYFDAVFNELPAALAAHNQLSQTLSSNLSLARSSPFHFQSNNALMTEFRR